MQLITFGSQQHLSVIGASPPKGSPGEGGEGGNSKAAKALLFIALFGGSAFFLGQAAAPSLGRGRSRGHKEGLKEVGLDEWPETEVTKPLSLDAIRMVGKSGTYPSVKKDTPYYTPRKYTSRERERRKSSADDWSSIETTQRIPRESSAYLMKNRAG